MNASGGLVAKLGALVLVTALTAAALLAVRQQRIMAAHDLIETHRRIVAHERSLRQVRSDIGQMIAPARVERLAAALGPMRPIPPELHDAQQRALAKAAKEKQDRKLVSSPKPTARKPADAAGEKLTMTREGAAGGVEDR